MGYTPTTNTKLAGDAQAVTASTSDADTSVATTAFVANYFAANGTPTSNRDQINNDIEDGDDEVRNDIMAVLDIPARTLLTASTFLGTATVAGKFFMRASGATVTTGSISDTPMLPFKADDYPLAIFGKTPKIRVRATMLTNAVAPGRSITVSLYPVTSNGGASGSNAVTLGTVVASSTVTFASGIGANTQDTQTSIWLPLPADGNYALVVEVLAGTTNASSTETISAQVQLHYE